MWGDTIFPTGIPFSLVNNVWGIQYSRGYRIHYDTGTVCPGNKRPRVFRDREVVSDEELACASRKSPRALDSTF